MLQGDSVRTELNHRTSTCCLRVAWCRGKPMYLGLMLKRCYWNPGSCSHSRRMNSTNTQAASKQIAPRAAGTGEKSPHLLWSHRGFYPLKMRGGDQYGVQKGVVFFHWPCLVTCISPCPVGVLRVEISHKSHVGFFFLLFSSQKLGHRGLRINVHLGVGTLPIVNKACGNVKPWSP